jgi:hypothetical protein
MGKSNFFSIHEYFSYSVLVNQLKPQRIELFISQKRNGRLSSYGLRFGKNFQLEPVLLDLKLGLEGIYWSTPVPSLGLNQLRYKKKWEEKE